MEATANTDMREDLEEFSLQRFDLLVENGNILWEPNDAVNVPSSPFPFQFRVASSLNIKPNLAADDPRRKTASNPFAGDDPEFNLGAVGPKHTLILNKFCVVRPQFVLHTNEFEPQADFLNAQDLDATWKVLCALKHRFIGIYNCGAAAGSSLGHKHLQFIPRPEEGSHPLFPDVYPWDKATSSVTEVPFQHAIGRLDSGVSSLEDTYARLCDLVGLNAGDAHNVILVEAWMLVIPRRCMRQGNITANAAAMIGIVWTTSDEVFQSWIKKGPMEG